MAGSLPTSFLRPAWRDAVLDAGQRRSAASGRRPPCSRCATGCAPATSGSRAAGNGAPSRTSSSRPPLFAAMREAGPLPVAVPATAEEYLAERRALLDRRLAEVAAKAAADRLEDVRIKGDELKITPLKAVTPEEAEDLAEPALRHGAERAHHRPARRGGPLDRVQRAPSPTCTPACRPTTAASCSPRCWPTPPTSA